MVDGLRGNWVVISKMRWVKMLGKTLKKVVKCALPYGLVQGFRSLKHDYKYSDLYLKFKKPEIFFVLSKNKIFGDKYSGSRCFILGTGPSVNKIDVTILKKEKCIFLSQFYLQKDYLKIEPEYHLFSGIGPHSHIPPKFVFEFFKQIEQKIPVTTNLFMNYLDREIILQNNFFKNHNVYYLYYKKNLNGLFAGKIDAARAMYEAGGVPIMAIQLAIYMGFKEIYLLGIDCTWDSGTSNNHCYAAEDSVVDHLGYLREDILANLNYIEREYRQFLNFLDQLRAVDGFARRANCKIYNATPGGKLEVFDRVDFNSLF